MAIAQEGDTVLIHYVGWLDDQTVFCDSRNDEPIELVIGENYLLPALEFALVGMESGEEKALRLAPDHGYGHYMPDLVFTVNASRIPPDSLPEIGGKKRVTIERDDEDVDVMVMRTTEQICVVDGNHPLVGKTLNFTVNLLEGY